MKGLRQFKINQVFIRMLFFSLFRFATLCFTMRKKHQQRGETLQVQLKKERYILKFHSRRAYLLLRSISIRSLSSSNKGESPSAL